MKNRIISRGVFFVRFFRYYNLFPPKTQSLLQSCSVVPVSFCLQAFA